MTHMMTFILTDGFCRMQIPSTYCIAVPLACFQRPSSHRPTIPTSSQLGHTVPTPQHQTGMLVLAGQRSGKFDKDSRRSHGAVASCSHWALASRGLDRPFGALFVCFFATTLRVRTDGGDHPEYHSGDIGREIQGLLWLLVPDGIGCMVEFRDCGAAFVPAVQRSEPTPKDLMPAFLEEAAAGWK